MSDFKDPRVKAISEILFAADPLGTCCKENDCFDEYDAIAFEITVEHDDYMGFDGSTAKLKVFFDEWTDGGFISHDVANKILKLL